MIIIIYYATQVVKFIYNTSGVERITPGMSLIFIIDRKVTVRSRNQWARSRWYVDIVFNSRRRRNGSFGSFVGYSWLQLNSDLMNQLVRSTWLTTPVWPWLVEWPWARQQRPQPTDAVIYPPHCVDVRPFFVYRLFVDGDDNSSRTPPDAQHGFVEPICRHCAERKRSSNVILV